MKSVHGDPAANGTVFGAVTVTVDLSSGDCVLHAQRPGPVLPVPQRVRFDSLDAIEAAYGNQISRAANDPMARDMARALKFAAEKLNSRKRDRT